MTNEDNGITATNRSTKDLGWPNSDIPIYVVNDQFYLPLKKVLEEFSLKEHVVKNGYKYIDKIIATHLPGKLPPSLFDLTTFPDHLPHQAYVNLSIRLPRYFHLFIVFLY